MASDSFLTEKQKAARWRNEWLRSADNRASQDKSINESRIRLADTRAVNTYSTPTPVNNYPTTIRSTTYNTTNRYDSGFDLTSAALGAAIYSAFDSSSSGDGGGGGSGD
jgi:hypothetical protein